MVRREKAIADLADQFVCVRLVKCNRLDLNLFQFDYDLTFAAFFLNADRTVYARYGIRTSQDADRDVSLDGLAKTMRAVLQIHAEYPKNKSQLAGKQPGHSEVEHPEQLPGLERFRPELDYEGKVARSCIHCHQIRDAQRLVYREQSKPIPLRLLYPYPAPATIGLVIDPKSKARISEVAPNSIASHAGLQVGDEVEYLAGQRITSAADIQWTLQHCEDGQAIDVNVLRSGEPVKSRVKLPAGWRRTTDISWRPTSWDLRRMATGGAIFESISKEARQPLAIPEDNMALRVKHVGLYGAHAIAMRAGVKKGDILIQLDSRTDLLTESQVIEYAIQNKRRGDHVSMVFLRGDKRFETKVRMQ